MLQAGIDNAKDLLQRAIPAYAAGKLDKPHDPHAMGVLYRQLGACRMLSEGIPEPVFVGQMQSVSAYLARLGKMPEDDKVTSRAGVFWDAIGGQYWEAASELAWHSRSSHNAAWEHEDDFLYVWFVMNRYFLDVPKGDDEQSKADCEERQRALLDRWEVVLEGGYDPRRLVCDALLRGDEQDFKTGFIEVADAREAKLQGQIEQRLLSQEHAAWFLPYWNEGLALLRLAERDGLATDDHCSMVPQIVRAPNTYAYDGGSWGRIDFGPRQRKG
ncbi:MAG: immunity 49 family protein [Deltaproteobacteria bacterium]|nr:immunity 49 family protein [Deltaproteobacteria bacterium]